MKLKFTLLSLAIALFSSNTFASHLMGGQITAKQIGGLQYQIKEVAYRDINGVPMSATNTFYYTDHTATWASSSTKPFIGPTSLLNGVEEYTYIDTITFPADGSYTIIAEDCCRNAAILNMSNPGFESFFLSTVVSVSASSSNSTPEFLNAPVTIAQVNNLLAYNPLPYDADGDSLSWSLVTPLSSSGVNVAGYNFPHANVAQPFTLSAATGQISWIPDVLGNFVSSFLVEEFRGGIKIGEIRRDMQILVINDSSNTVRATLNTSGWPTNGSGNYSFALPASSLFNLTIVATDANNDLLNLNANGAPFAAAINPAYFSSASGLGIASCDISWTPNPSQIRNGAYNIAFRLLEHHGIYTYATDKTVQFQVTQALSVKDISASTNDYAIFPNPTNGGYSLPFFLEKESQVKIEVLNASGELVSVLVNKTMNAGKNVILSADSKLNKGIYTVAICVDGKKLATKKLVITE